MFALDRKALRNLCQQKWQFVAIALVIGCGVAMIVMAWSMLASLEGTLLHYYDEYRFASVFAHLKRAPVSVTERLAAVRGVAQVETRVVGEVNLDLPGLLEPCVGRLISLADDPTTALHRLHLRSGRLPAPGVTGEVTVSEGFAVAHQLRSGDVCHAVLNGRRQELRIVGVAISPEYVYQVRGGEIIPNDRTFAVFWMQRREVASAFDMEGAFNDVLITLVPGGIEAEVIAEVDEILDRYGGVGAYGRDLHSSHRYVANEMNELRNMGTIAPMIFLSVAAFLLYIVLTRIVRSQQVEIATLKAFGYRRSEITQHFLKLTMAIVVAGVVAGIGGGIYLGWGLTGIYVRFYRFPVLEFHVRPAVIVGAVAFSMGTAVLGVFLAVRRAALLAPAVAMRPEPPATFRASLVERMGLARFLSPPNRMIIRHLESRPLTTGLSVLGLSMAVGTVVLGSHAIDAIHKLLDFQFFQSQRQSVTVGFFEPTSSSALHELARLPGVVEVEPFRDVAAVFYFHGRTRRQGISGLVERPSLYRLIDIHDRQLTLASDGLLMSKKLAELLGAKPGDTVQVRLQEGHRPTVDLRIDGVIDDMIGTSAFLRIDVVRRLLREGDTISGAFLRAHEDELPNIYRALKEAPRVAAVASKQVALESIRKSLATSILVMRTINLTFATIIACGVVYNSARIALAERSRSLASLRVLGYTRYEISYILLGELGVLTGLAILPGLVLGYGLVVFNTWSHDTDLFRIPAIVYPATYGLAVIVVGVASLVAALVVRRQLDKLDLVAVLKAQE